MNRQADHFGADQARAAFLRLPEAKEDFPFGPEVSVFKVLGKMFGTLGERNGAAEINLKCDPQQAVALREIFPGVIPGYHMNKLHWNTVILNGSVPTPEISRMVDHSYALVVRGLKKAERESLVIRHGRAAVFRDG